MPSCTFTEHECSVLYSIFFRLENSELSSEEQLAISRLAEAAGVSSAAGCEEDASVVPARAVSPLRQGKRPPVRKQLVQKEVVTKRKVRNSYPHIDVDD